ncbi:MAG TPA: TIGR02266 family protein, partial [Polyangia bacterium]|nr:TIGR02266 family protein [Polyangia bacterium]
MEQPPPKETRVPVNLRIKFRSETIEQFVDRYAVDVSRGGIFIRTREPLAVGTQLRFDFQLQDTTPLMAGEGTVVWIREHDPSRAGVTPGMGVRFDKLTPPSQRVLDRILADKTRRESNVPTGGGAASATGSGKSGAGPLPVRRPSSTFSALDPAAAGVPAAPQSTVGTNPGIGGPLNPPVGGTTLPFGSVPSAGPGSSPALKPLGAAASLAAGPAAKPATASPAAAVSPGKTPAPSSGALPTLESQSALGRLATGPNLSAFAPLGPRGKSLEPLLAKGAPPPAARDATGPVAAGSGTPGGPAPVEDSDRTQIADGLPDFAGETTLVGGQSQDAADLADLMSGRAATITATSRRSLTPSADPRRSLDAGFEAGTAATAPGARAPAGTGAETSGASAMRTTSPDGMTEAVGGSGPGRLSASQPVVANPAPGPAPTVDSDLARTVPAAARMSATTSSMRSTTPATTPQLTKKKRPTVAIVIGVLVGAAAAAVIAFQMSGSGPATTGGAPAPEPTAAAPAASANPAASPQGTPAPGSVPVAANPAGEPKPGEAPAMAGEAAKPAAGVAPEGKPGEATAEPKPVEGTPAGSKPAEANPAEPVPAMAEAAPGAKPGRKPRLTAHKKGAGPNKAETALEAAAATGGDDTGAAAEGNVARVISLPSGAEVLIDGQSVGKTPFVSKDIDPSAPHALTIRKDGFETYEHMVSSSDWIKGKGNGQTLKQAVKLRKTRATGEPEGAAGDRKVDK